MDQEQTFVKLTSEDFHKSPIYIAPHEIGAIIPGPSYTDILMRGSNFRIGVIEKPADIFRLLNETHERALASAKEALRKNMHHGTTFSINDPGAH